jgi:hypothetical protein
VLSLCEEFIEARVDDVTLASGDAVSGDGTGAVTAGALPSLLPLLDLAAQLRMSGVAEMCRAKLARATPAVLAARVPSGWLEGAHPEAADVVRQWLARSRPKRRRMWR